MICEDGWFLSSNTMCRVAVVVFAFGMQIGAVTAIYFVCKSIRLCCIRQAKHHRKIHDARSWRGMIQLRWTYLNQSF